MKPAFFDSDMKMADMLQDNYHFLQMLDRFEIKFGFGDQTIEEVCNEYHIHIPFFLLIANVFHFNEYEPKASDIESCPPNELLKYLQKSHKYYLSYRFPDLEQRLKGMMSSWDQVTAKIVETFFSEYKKEVQIHLAYEDEVVFPYIRKLMSNDTAPGYSIFEFEKKHDDIESKVKDLKNILIKYIPEKNDVIQRNEILFHLYLLEEDLNKHLLMENKVLIPVVLKMEGMHKPDTRHKL